MAVSTCDGELYLHNLSAFIRTHERQLANALQAYKKPASNNTRQKETAPSYDKPIRLSLTVHHLFYILGRFQELGINVGPMNIRLDDEDSHVNYVSFLSDFHHSKLRASDAQSIHSMSSVQSVMSSVSALWSSLNAGPKNKENIVFDIKYLCSAFTKLPCLRLAPDKKARLIEGSEEYPFDTAVPIQIFKNISVLELSECEPKELYGWVQLSEQIKFLVIKKTKITDPAEVLVDLVENDCGRRRSSSYGETMEQNSSPTTRHIPISLTGSLEHPLSSSLSSSHNSWIPDLGPPKEETSKPKVYRRSYQTKHGPMSPNGRQSRRSDSISRPFKEDHPPRWGHLRHLSLSDNKITSISRGCLDNLKSLSSLDLSKNSLSEIPMCLAKLVNLKSLNLSYNKLTSSRGFARGSFTKLTILSLRGNKISSLESLENFVNLEKLDLRDNQLAQVRQLKPLLQPCEFEKKLVLEALYVMGNSLTNNRGYRIELFNLFNALDHRNALKLDGSRPGIFESRLLADEKGAEIKLKQFLDESIISTMTEKMSTLNINRIETPTEVATPTSPTRTSTFIHQLKTARETELFSLSPPAKPFARGSQSFENTVPNQTSESIDTLVQASDTHTIGGESCSGSLKRNSQDSNPAHRISTATPALPVITATTTTITSSLAPSGELEKDATKLVAECK